MAHSLQNDPRLSMTPAMRRNLAEANRLLDSQEVQGEKRKAAQRVKDRIEARAQKARTPATNS